MALERDPSLLLLLGAPGISWVYSDITPASALPARGLLLFLWDSVPLLRTRSTGLRTHWSNPGQSPLRMLSSVISAKTLFPNEVTFTSSGN